MLIIKHFVKGWGYDRTTLCSPDKSCIHCVALAGLELVIH